MKTNSGILCFQSQMLSFILVLGQTEAFLTLTQNLVTNMNEKLCSISGYVEGF